MEEDLRKIAPGLFATNKEDLDKEITGRVDIRYSTIGGKHMIVELKRYDIKVDATKLAQQGSKYAKALRDILGKQQLDNQVQNIEVVFVLGQRPGTKDWVEGINEREAYIASTFSAFRGSYRLYDSLISSARNQYQDYLDASSHARKLDELLAVLAPDAAGIPAISAPAPPVTVAEPA